MKKIRIEWAAWIIFMLIILVFTDNYGMRVTAALSAAIPTAGIVMAAATAGKLSAKIEGQISQVKGKTFKYTVLLKNSSVFSCPRGKVMLKTENLLTGEVFHEEIVFSSQGRRTRTIECGRIFSHCGKVKIEIEAIQVWDLIGAYMRDIQSGENITALIMPDTFPLVLNMENGSQNDINSDEYSMLKSGPDPSETFAIREYRTGDKIKNIHWKLSEKLGEVTIRETGLPVNNSVLLLFSNVYGSGENAPEPKVRDAIGEAVASIAQELLRQQIPYILGWYDGNERRIKTREILTAEDLYTSIADILSAGPAEKTLGCLSIFEEERGKPEYAHVIVIGTERDEAMDRSVSDGLITDLVCVSKKSNPYERTIGGQIMYFNPETMAQDLSYIEV